MADAAPMRIAYPGCPLCDTGDALETMVADCSAHPLYRPPLPSTQRWLTCWNCGHMFVDGYFTQDALAVLFSATHENQTPGHDAESQRYVWARVLDRVGALRGSMGGRWLDVGFGNGMLMTTAAEYGYDVAGLDLRAQSVALMAELGYDVQAIDFESYRPAAPFDVISMADVLEHMPYPARALRHAHALLREGGLLFLSMPNADAFVWTQMTRQGVNPYWGEIEHYHNFGRARLFALLEECGLRPERYGVSERYRACMEVLARKA